MSLPSLNSVHLQALPRRDGYRRARALLLRTRGDQTIIAEQAVRLPSARVRTSVELSGATRYLLQSGATAYPLRTGMNFLGRFADSDIPLGDLQISRRHCAIVVHYASGCELHDLASKNGTFFNGERLSHPVWLVVGDQIRLCGQTFTFATAEEVCCQPADGRTLMD